MSLRSHKTVKLWSILIFLLVDGRIRVLEAQNHTNPMDLDLEHSWEHSQNLKSHSSSDNKQCRIIRGMKISTEGEGTK